jgi:hypothetical protein
MSREKKWWRKIVADRKVIEERLVDAEKCLGKKRDWQKRGIQKSAARLKPSEK